MQSSVLPNFSVAAAIDVKKWNKLLFWNSIAQFVAQYTIADLFISL
jgi:hypothetical protein